MLLFAAPVKIAASGFSVSGYDHAKADVWLERFAEVLRRNPRLEIATSADFAHILGMERPRISARGSTSPANVSSVTVEFDYMPNGSAW